MARIMKVRAPGMGKIQQWLISLCVWNIFLPAMGIHITLSNVVDACFFAAHESTSSLKHPFRGNSVAQIESDFHQYQKKEVKAKIVKAGGHEYAVVQAAPGYGHGSYITLPGKP